MNVIFHVNESERFNHCFSNVSNLLKGRALEEVDDIRILMNGPSVELTQKNVEEKIEELLNSNINISVCQNSLNKLKIDSNELCEGIEIVPAGVFELMKRQEQGYSYIKP